MSEYTNASLINFANSIRGRIINDSNFIDLVNEIKLGYISNNHHWTSELNIKKNRLKELIEEKVFYYYRIDLPDNTQRINEREKQSLIEYLKSLQNTTNGLSIYAKGHEDNNILSFIDSELLNTEEFYFRKSNFIQKNKNRTGIKAQLTIDVDKTHFQLLTQALAKIISDSPPDWLEQAKIIGTDQLGRLTDQAVIYLSEASLEHAQEIRRRLKTLLPPSAFIEHTSVGMQRLDLGISYSEMPYDITTSHGQTRANIIATALTESLITDKQLDKVLPRVLQEQGYDVNNPSLMAQALNERRLHRENSTENFLQNNVASYDILQFLSDPLMFTQNNTINSKHLNQIERLPAGGRVIFSKNTLNNYSIEFVLTHSSRNIALSIYSYFLEKPDSVQSNKVPRYVDIPKYTAEDSFLFTGILSGSSIIVTELNDKTYRVYHDGRINSSILYDNVVMAIDYQNYQIFGTDGGIATAYMHFKHGQWKLVLQRQEYQIIEGELIPVLRQREAPMEVLFANDNYSNNSKKRFIEYREKIHKKIKSIAHHFNIDTKDALSSRYIEGEYSIEHPTFMHWVNLHNKLTKKINERRQQLHELSQQLKNEYQRLINDENRSVEENNRIDELRNLIEINKINHEYYRQSKIPVLSEILSVERSWLWQKIKEKDGIEAVIQHTAEDIRGNQQNSSEIASINRRYESMSLEHAVSENTDFYEGISQYQEIYIHGFNEDMTSTQMKELYINNEINAKQRGALYQYIEEKMNAEYINNILKYTSKINLLFQKAGSIENRLAPQDFYLSLMGDKSGGRCYPLVRAMSVALEHSGRSGAHEFIDKLFIAAANPREQNSILLKTGLKNLHSNIDAKQASISYGQLDLNSINRKLINNETSINYALNTPSHSMLLGKNVKNGSVNYYFYDPNFGFFVFDNNENLLSALNLFMYNENFSILYNAEGEILNPTFELIELNADKMGVVSVGEGLSVLDLVQVGDLDITRQYRKRFNDFVNSQGQFESNIQTQGALSILEAKQWSERIKCSVNKIIQENHLDETWMPIFANVESLDNDKYRVQFIHDGDIEETRWIETSDSAFLAFRHYFNEQIEKLRTYYVFDGTDLQRNGLVGDVEPLDGLNMGMALQTLIQWIDSKNNTNNDIQTNLSVALKIHSYINYSVMTYGAVHDATKIAKLTYLLWQGKNSAKNIALNNFSVSLAHTANEGAGIVFSGALVGFDAYELSQAQNEQQKAIFGTQLAFDSATFVAGVSGPIAGLAGASTTAAVFGGATVLLGGVAIGFTGLARAFSVVANDAKAVGVYFNYLDQAYQGDGFDYQSEHSLLIPRFGGVFQTINFRDNKIIFDSQYIYRTHESSAGDGRRNIVGWVGNFPHSIKDRSQALNIRENIGYQENVKNMEHPQANIIILPSTPKSYIDYHYNLLPGATSRHDLGFDIIRRLEQTDRFDYDFYSFPSENTITQLIHEYTNTPVDVLLDFGHKHVVVPHIPNQYRHKLEYKIKGLGGDYQVSINHNAKITLSDDANYGMKSRWLIDTSLIGDGNIQVFTDRIKVGMTDIYIDSSIELNNIKIINTKNEVRQIDSVKLTANVISEDGDKWRKGISLDTHLQKLSQSHQLNEKFMSIENYQHNGKNVGRAFYDTENDRMIFTNSTNEENHTALLGAIVDDYAYFFTPIKAMAWRVNIHDGSIDKRYDASSLLGRHSEGIRLWQDHGQVYLLLGHPSDGRMVTSTYRLSDNRFELINVGNNATLLKKMATLPGRLSPHQRQLISIQNQLLNSSESHGLVKREREIEQNIENILPTEAETIMIFGRDDHGIAHRYWLRPNEGTLVKPNLPVPNGEFVQRDYGELQQSQWPIPDDLTLISSQLDDDGIEVFFFFSQQEKMIFRQKGVGQDQLNHQIATAERIIIPQIEQVINWQNNLLAVTDRGVIKQVFVNNPAKVVAVNEQWLKSYPRWWSEINSIADDGQFITLLGLKDENQQNIIPAWYCNGKMVIARSLPSSNTLNFFGIDQGNQQALIFDTQTGKLHSQKTVSRETVSTVFGTNSWIQQADLLPLSVELYPELTFKNIKKVQNGLIMQTQDDEILYHALSGGTMGAGENSISSSLMIRGGDDNDILQPSYIDGVSTLLLSGSESSDSYRFKRNAWQEYQTIIIDNYAMDNEIDRILLPIEDVNQVIVNQKGDDLILTDNAHQTQLILRQVFGEQSEAYRHLHLDFHGKSESINLTDLINQLSLYGEVMPLFIYCDKNGHQLGSISTEQLDVLINDMTLSSIGSNINLQHKVEHFSENVFLSPLVMPAR
ncbi:TcdA/TcdB pore-forming domain-containing protein [Providencia rettgeri]|nr:TcdA/TcdB pore-forming domain-containing protein [Providencia rettgeri]